MLSWSNIFGTWNQLRWDSRCLEIGGYSLCLLQSPSLHIYAPLASWCPEIFLEITVWRKTQFITSYSSKHNVSSVKTTMILKISWYLGIILGIKFKLKTNTSLLDFNISPMFITFAMLDKLKGCWPSRRWKENIAADKPLPYENITTLLPSWKRMNYINFQDELYKLSQKL